MSYSAKSGAGVPNNVSSTGQQQQHQNQVRVPNDSTNSSTQFVNTATSAAQQQQLQQQQQQQQQQPQLPNNIHLVNTGSGSGSGGNMSPSNLQQFQFQQQQFATLQQTALLLQQQQFLLQQQAAQQNANNSNEPLALTRNLIAELQTRAQQQSNGNANINAIQQMHQLLLQSTSSQGQPSLLSLFQQAQQQISMPFQSNLASLANQNVIRTSYPASVQQNTSLQSQSTTKHVPSLQQRTNHSTDSKTSAGSIESTTPAVSTVSAAESSFKHSADVTIAPMKSSNMASVHKNLLASVKTAGSTGLDILPIKATENASSSGNRSAGKDTLTIDHVLEKNEGLTIVKATSSHLTQPPLSISTETGNDIEVKITKMPISPQSIKKQPFSPTKVVSNKIGGNFQTKQSPRKNTKPTKAPTSVAVPCSSASSTAAKPTQTSNTTTFSSVTHTNASTIISPVTSSAETLIPASPISAVSALPIPTSPSSAIPVSNTLPIATTATSSGKAGNTAITVKSPITTQATSTVTTTAHREPNAQTTVSSAVVSNNAPGGLAGTSSSSTATPTTTPLPKKTPDNATSKSVSVKSSPAAKMSLPKEVCVPSTSDVNSNSTACKELPSPNEKNAASLSESSAVAGCVLKETDAKKSPNKSADLQLPLKSDEKECKSSTVSSIKNETKAESPAIEQNDKEIVQRDCKEASPTHAVEQILHQTGKETSPTNPVVKSTPTTDSQAKQKRHRYKTIPYQSPIPEVEFVTKLSVTESKRVPLKNVGDRLVLFYKGEFLAVRNADHGFFLCQTLHNVYKTSPRIRIRWLSEQKKCNDVYVPDFYDITDLECVLTSLELGKANKTNYRLSVKERGRIENILKKAIDVEKGVLPRPNVTEENPDGLDLSLYKDESQIEKRSPLKRKIKTPLQDNYSRSKLSKTNQKVKIKRKIIYAKNDSDDEDYSPTTRKKQSKSEQLISNTPKAGKHSLTRSTTVSTSNKMDRRHSGHTSLDEDSDDNKPLITKLSAKQTKPLQKISPMKATDKRTSAKDKKTLDENATASSSTRLKSNRIASPTTAAPHEKPTTPTTRRLRKSRL